MSDPNKPQRPRRPVSREADYGETKRVETVRPTAAPRPKPSAGAPSSKRKAPPKKKASVNFAAVFIATVIIGVIVCVTAFAVAFRAMLDRTADPSATSAAPTSTGAPSAATPMPNGQTTMPVSNEQTSTALAILLAVNANDSSLSLYDATHNMQRAFIVDGTTSLRDKFGHNIAFAELVAGDIVDISMEQETGRLAAVKVSAQAWVRTNITRAEVNPDAKTVTVGNEVYHYNAHLFAQYNGEQFDITELDPAHTVTLRGHQSELLFLEVTRSFGYISLAANPNILNGTAEINMDMYPLADTTRPVKVAEGTHRIIITGTNIDRYETEITVTPGETVSVNLESVNLKAGILTININEPNATITLNGVAKNAAEPFVADYANYILRVEKDGFEPHEQTFTFDEPSREIAVTLVPMPRMASVPLVTMPAGADIYVNGAHVGKSPLRITAAPGTYAVTLRMADYEEVNFSVTLDDNTALPVYTLQPLAGVVMPEDQDQDPESEDEH